VESNIAESGTYEFYEDDKYILLHGVGRISWPGLSVELIDNKQVYTCILTKEEAENIVLENGIVSFTETALVEDSDKINEVKTNKRINIDDFCRKL
jgi:hypothetical protein